MGTEWRTRELAHLLDERAAAVLWAVYRQDDPATVADLRRETELPRGALYHRLADLSRLDLIERGRRNGRLAVALTPAAEASIDDGLLEEYDLVEADVGDRIWRRWRWLEGVVHR